MDYEEIIKRATEKAQDDDVLARQPYFTRTVAWFHYLGLLKHNNILPHRYHPDLADVLKAGVVEPRVLELLPAVLILLPEAVRHEKREIPKDLAAVIDDIHHRRDCKPFRGVPPEKYRHWLNAPIMDIARRRLDFRGAPRRRSVSSGGFGDIIREGRMKLCLTQEEFAKKNNLSLRVVRDLEQGKTTASVASLIAILAVFGRTLRA
ncbi:MAG: hypothetical protein RIQ81_1120 [Pseudomonadota bacterium]|jgi:DNA-binding XRE family transcriptional regulator